MYLLDTDHIGIIQRQAGAEYVRLWARITGHYPDQFFISVVSFQEQVNGWNTYIGRARTTVDVVRAYAMFERILADFAVGQLASFNSAAANIFDSLRAQRIRIGTMDLRIGSIALAHDLTVLTRNVVDFSQIPGLRIEDWTV